jgi:glutathione S-transferase
MKLYNFFRSSASYRVRIAMALKGLSYDNVSINLGKGEQHQPSYGAVNPQEIVPTLENHGRLITQSLAICEYLDETHPNPPILPRDPAGRARVRALALAVACEIHPVVGKGQNYLASALNGFVISLRRASKRSRRCSLTQRRRAASATAIRRQSRTLSWCRRSTTHSAPASI